MLSVVAILAHTADAQLATLIRRLLKSDVGILVHLDSRADDAWRIETTARVVVLTDRYPTAWGSYEAVLAALALLREARRRWPEAKSVSLISGQDYPLLSPDDLTLRLALAGDQILAKPLRSEQWRYGGTRRIDRYYWARNRKSLWGFLWRTIPLPPRRFPLPLDRLSYGSQWWTLRAQTIDRLLAFVEERPDVLRAFRWTYVPDELFFATVLVGYLGLPVTNDHKRHIEWFGLKRDWLRFKVLGRNGIRTLGPEDLPALAHSPAWFARKFDFARDPEMPGLLDQITAVHSHTA